MTTTMKSVHSMSNTECSRTRNEYENVFHAHVTYWYDIEMHSNAAEQNIESK